MDFFYVTNLTYGGDAGLGCRWRIAQHYLVNLRRSLLFSFVSSFVNFLGVK